ncbi:STAS domain-containing protein [Miltoncostaea oceani]|uniref:STAS domain-containing protein n=1 Tax=Miltoncostaea oceani TaxID=2843216 RepID=UPI001C3D0E45|nr:STAS domain-containing protein [Miltoncostaea oceani]
MSASAVRTDDGVVLLVLSGDLDIWGAADAAAMLESVSAETSATVHVDLRAVEVIDAVGLALLRRAHRNLHSHGGRLVVDRARIEHIPLLGACGLTP